MRRDKIKYVLQAILITLFSLIFIGSGFFHLIEPAKYLPIIPPYLSFPKTLNLLTGIFEIIFGLGLLIGRTRKDGAYGIILLLLAFFTVHIYMIQLAPMTLEGIEILPWMAWARLLFQFVLIYLAWYISQIRLSLFRKR